MTFPIDVGFHSFRRKIFIPVISHTCWIASASPRKNCGCKIIYLLRLCSDYVGVEQEHCLDGVLLEPGTQVRQEKPHC